MDKAIYEKQKEVYPTALAQQTLQQQQIAAQLALKGMDMHKEMQENQAILLEQADPKKVGRSIILLFQGKQEVEGGSIEQVTEPILNKYGLERVWFYIAPVVNMGTSLSHLEEGEAGRLLMNIENALVDELTLDWKAWGIKDKTWLDSVVNCILNPCYLVLKRAEGQNEKNWLGKISFENLNNASKINMPKKDGFWSKFKI